MTGPELSVVFSASLDDDLFTGVTQEGRGLGTQVV